MIKQKYSTKIMIGKMVEVFKTDVKDKNLSVQLVRKLKKHFPESYINFDLDDCDHILRVEGENISVQSVILLMKNFGYRCEVLL